MIFPNRICIVQNNPETVKALSDLGYTVLTVSPTAGLDAETSAHADMLVHISPDGTVFVHSSQTELSDRLHSYGIKTEVLSHSFGKYPLDVAFNVARMGLIGVGRKSAVHPQIIGYYGENFIDVRQGYAKCSVCSVGDNAVITEDAGIAEKLQAKGIDVLLISKGDVYLSEIHYGFFGGATGSPDAETLLINGELKTHRDCKIIEDFLSVHGVTPIELKKGKVCDIGSILFI